MWNSLGGESQEDLIDIKCFNTTNQVINSSMDLDEVLNMFKDILLNQASEFQERDSGQEPMKFHRIHITPLFSTLQV
ncbi:hypothetical protein NQ315_012230 [Exocentrus adspersus]|uniref:Uncharacterized protein n=1 Tax=Exocentrus adspersus TaxID=1586481 RepID=A0AAV8VAR9_9CUCU|nr:hypothetical protein NQ315_012230 [Exocentrus adspersus]